MQKIFFYPIFAYNGCMKMIEQYILASNNIAKAFIKKYYERAIEGDDYWIGGEIGVMQVGDQFWSIHDMVYSLENDISSDILFNWYEFGIFSEGDRLNLKTFSRLWDGTGIVKWTKEYCKKQEENRLYWQSPEGKKKSEEQMKEMIDKFKLSI